MTGYYAEQLEKAAKFQDFVVDQLREQRGIVVSVYSSMDYQYNKGESAQRIEIKYDKRLEETRNIYFETAEKSSAGNEDYVKSGIFRDDNTVLFMIGNYTELFVFAKRHLKNMYRYYDANPGEAKADGVRMVETPTSRGMCVPTTAKLVATYFIDYMKFENKEG